MRGVVAGAGAAALAPLAARGIGRLVRGGGAEALGELARATGSDGLNEFADRLSRAVGQTSAARRTIPGVGRGRRLPVQQEVDVGAPIETVYNQWTQVELWPKFMHRVTDVSRRDACTIAFSTKVWGSQKEFVARIETQRPDERIKWKVEKGLSHTGVVTFHELGPRLTRVLVGLDLEPGGMLEMAARGLRHIERAVRADLHRFKAFVEMQEVETGAWRGVIENGKVAEEHDPSYDKGREYSKFRDIFRGPRADKPTPAKSSRPSSAGRRAGASGSRSGARSSSASGSSGSAARGRSSTNRSSASSGSSRGRSRSAKHSDGRTGSRRRS